MNQCNGVSSTGIEHDRKMRAAAGRGDARNPIEKTIAQIWAKVLGVDRVDIHDNFLLLGGESLMATQIASEVMSQLDVEVSIRSILVGTVAEVAEEVAA